MITACARCEHSQTAHFKESNRRGAAPRNPKTCRLCDCPKWVGGVCSFCGAFQFSWMGECESCYRQHALMKRVWGLVWINSPERLREKEIEEQRKWLRDGKKTLGQIRQVLRAPSLSPSPAAESSQDRTSP